MTIEDQQKDRMKKDPENYKWGLFYFNKYDPRILVPKRNNMMGWTLNFASPYSYLFLIAIVLIAVAAEKFL
ncbi:MAG TPA: DUF5808 domain-containing protein [Bacteroidales bacterium]|nr:DUF5808 domain-containing protein [Bacteroidales bacterium]